MQQQDRLLKDYTGEERTAYLKAIAAIATADRTASDNELQFLEALAETAELSPEETQELAEVANQPATEAQFRESLDKLKGSDLRYSLITDLVTFAEADQNYSDPEKAQIAEVARYMDVSQEQFSTINQFVTKAAHTDMQPGDVTAPQNFLEKLGMENQFKNAGMNFGNISKGLLGTLIPLILGKMMSGNRSGGGGGGLGGLLGGLLGGGGGGLGGALGGAFGGSPSPGAGSPAGGGGLGSLISMLSGGRGMGDIGGMLSRMFGKK
ncbi:MAG: hypothetical protein K0Q66_203 [Chitinophagaceae bacterium]|nr:hypothetical protein [Chitinophagaceae bacterium]